MMIEKYIGMLQAIHRNEGPIFNPDRKDPHWGKRKLAANGLLGCRPANALSHFDICQCLRSGFKLLSVALWGHHVR
jgi:hypothetical protein